ncbi:hypothetical protein Afil01_07690 [Actinorhabdospora filicis]|uniref:Major capsid protein n=1 Tax=Actinorhabdospora filicis TaxID=1785913 RepID=A0A9W6SHJ3_9ACTN|nr:hypothetical protein [Actinorhabdospora filicis]GLZ75962.1 hypothetical protein Afil01_07690 [Actinorhabdospora filicis]
MSVTTTPSQIGINDVVAATLTAIRKRVVLPNLMYREAQSGAGTGDTVYVRKPSVFKANDLARGEDIKPNRLKEELIPVKLDVHAESSVILDTIEQSTELSVFASQVLTPIVNAVVDRAETRSAVEINKALKATGENKPVELKADAAMSTVLLDVDEKFQTRSITEGVRLVVSPAGRKAILSDPQFISAEKFGNAMPVQRGQIGSILGMPVFTSPYVEGLGVAFTREYAALANVIPAAMLGNAESEARREDGYGIRVSMGEVFMKLSSIVAADVLIGGTVLDPARAVGIVAAK